MTILQLNPPIPVFVVGKGTGQAHVLIDYSPEHHLYWIVFLDKDAECWTVCNTDIRAQFNHSLDRAPSVRDINNGREL